jgi:hypothetical protein
MACDATLVRPTTTQAFFSLEAGIPTTLEPDFATRSCNIVFGRPPPPRSEDPAFTEPCFAVACSSPAPGGGRMAAGHRAAVLMMASGELPPLSLQQEAGAQPSGAAAPPEVVAPARR